MIQDAMRKLHSLGVPVRYTLDTLPGRIYNARLKRDYAKRADVQRIAWLCQKPAQDAKAAKRWRASYRWRMMTSWMRLALGGAFAYAMPAILGSAFFYGRLKGSK